MAQTRTVNLYPKPTTGVTTGERLVVDGTTKSFATVYNGNTRYVTLDVVDADVYVTFHGQTPSATVGHRLYAGRSYTWSVEAARAAKFTRATTTSAAIWASEFTD